LTGAGLSAIAVARKTMAAKPIAVLPKYPADRLNVLMKRTAIGQCDG
jgi:hypothetical protein